MRTISRRFLGLLLLVGGALIVFQLLGKAPVTLDLRYRFGSDATMLRRATVVYLDQQGTIMRQVSFDYPGGAPVEQHHRIRLPKGTYSIEVRLSYLQQGRPETSLLDRSLARRLVVVGEQETLVDLSGQPP